MDPVYLCIYRCKKKKRNSNRNPSLQWTNVQTSLCTVYKCTYSFCIGYTISVWVIGGASEFESILAQFT